MHVLYISSAAGDVTERLLFLKRLLLYWRWGSFEVVLLLIVYSRSEFPASIKFGKPLCALSALAAIRTHSLCEGYALKRTHPAVFLHFSALLVLSVVYIHCVWFGSTEAPRSRWVRPSVPSQCYPPTKQVDIHLLVVFCGSFYVARGHDDPGQTSVHYLRVLLNSSTCST